MKHRGTSLPDSIGTIKKITSKAEEVLPESDYFIIGVPAVAH